MRTIKLNEKEINILKLLINRKRGEIDMQLGTNCNSEDYIIRMLNTKLELHEILNKLEA